MSREFYQSSTGYSKTGLVVPTSKNRSERSAQGAKLNWKGDQPSWCHQAYYLKAGNCKWKVARETTEAKSWGKALRLHPKRIRYPLELWNGKTIRETFARGRFSPSDYKQAQKAVKLTKNLWGKPDSSINKAPKRNRTEKIRRGWDPTETIFPVWLPKGRWQRRLGVSLETLKWKHQMSRGFYQGSTEYSKTGLVVPTSKNRSERSAQDAKLVTGRETNRAKVNQRLTL